METESEPLSKSQEIPESGYSSEKPSTLASPASLEDSQESKNVDSTLNSLDDCEPFTLVTKECLEHLKNGDNQENTNSTGIELNFEDSSQIKDNSSFEIVSSADLVSSDGTTGNFISSSNNSIESPSSPVEKEVNDEKIIDDNDEEKIKANEKDNDESSKYLLENSLI